MDGQRTLYYGQRTLYYNGETFCDVTILAFARTPRRKRAIPMLSGPDVDGEMERVGTPITLSGTRSLARAALETYGCDLFEIELEDGKREPIFLRSVEMRSNGAEAHVLAHGTI